MDKLTPGPMTPFDELVTTPKLQIMKLLIPYTPESGRKMLAAFIKFTEFKETLRMFSHSDAIHAQNFGNNSHASPHDIIDSFRPYLNAEQQTMLDTIANMSEMLSLMEMLQTSAQDSDNGNENIFDPMELLSGMLSPEQQEAFRMYSDMFSESEMKKGDKPDERMDESPGSQEY